jgi:TldD protein
VKTRRDFLKDGSLTAAALAAVGAFSPSDALAGAIRRAAGPIAREIPSDSEIKALMADALNAAKLAGAGYADVRIGRYRNNFVITREKQIINTVDTDSLGCGVRVLVNGTWGFAATRNLTRDGVVGAAREAAIIAKANKVASDQPVQLTPVQAYPNATWKSAYTIDPFTVPIEDKAKLLIDANTEALKVKGVRFVTSGMFFVKEERSFASTEGSVITQTAIRSWLPIQIAAVAADFSDFQNRSNVVQPAGRG